MNKTIEWKKGFFKSIYDLRYDGKSIGTLRDKTWSESSIGEINGKSYVFRTKGFIKQQTEIIDHEFNNVIGRIKYSTWMNKAEMTFTDKVAFWKYENLLQTDWSLKDTEGNIILYRGGLKGKIRTNTDDPLLILSGLYVSNYYMQITFFVIMMALIAASVTFIN